MKTRFFAPVALAAALATSASVFAVQADPAPSAPTAPQKQIRISDGASVLLKMSKGQVTEEVIIAYIDNARRNFDLSADEIVYLKQEGVPDKVVTAALNHHAKIPQAVVTVPQEPALAQAQAPAQSQPTVVVAPPQTTYVQAPSEPVYVYSSPSYSYYYDPFPFYYSYYPYRYYGYRSYYPYRYPSVSVNFGFGHGYYGGYRGYGGAHNVGFGSHATFSHGGFSHGGGFGGGAHAAVGGAFRGHR